MLQLLRGCGVDGASAMGETHRQFLRPLLDVSRRTLSDYAQTHKLEWIEDESNQDTRFDRNFLRHQIFPLLEQRFPAYRETLARSARHFAESSHLLSEVATSDGLAAIRQNRLSITCLSQLSVARARELLRHFLKLHGVLAPSEVRLEEMLRQLLNAKQDAKIHFELGTMILRRFNTEAWLTVASGQPARVFFSQRWNEERQVYLPALGKTLEFRPAIGMGISLNLLQQGPVNLQSRVGGEALKPDCQRPRRSLKHLLQEARIPPWERGGLPLIYCDGRLAAVMNIGIDCEFQARPGEKGVVLEWI